MLATLTAGEAYGPLAAVPGLAGGSLLAVVLAERWGRGGTAAVEAADNRRARPTRSHEDRLIAGVCGGWARERGHDPRRVRAILAVVGPGSVLLLGPLGLLLGVADVFAWLTWPLAPDEEPAASPGAEDRGQPPRSEAR